MPWHQVGVIPQSCFEGVAMSLADKLTHIRNGAARIIPSDKLKTMNLATQELRASGILERVIKPGMPLPPFTLTNMRGARVESQNLFERGAVVLTVFRGHW
jgi:hypothetical protein